MINYSRKQRKKWQTIQRVRRLKSQRQLLRAKRFIRSFASHGYYKYWEDIDPDTRFEPQHRLIGWWGRRWVIRFLNNGMSGYWRDIPRGFK